MSRMRVDSAGTLERVQALPAFLLVYGIVVIKQVLTWFVVYRFAGYNYVTLNATQAVTLLLGTGFVTIYRLGWRRIGLGSRKLREGAAVVAVAHVVLLGALLTLRTVGAEVPLFRDTYRLDALFNNWVLTGFAEELVFAGVIFGLALVALGRERQFPSAWPVVILVAAMFSLWLTAFVHASTDYALLPAITGRPLAGLIFMLTNVALAWWLGRRHQWRKRHMGDLV